MPVRTFAPHALLAAYVHSFCYTERQFFGADDSIELGFAVDDLAMVRSRLQAGGSAISEIQAMGWVSGFDATDPDGHRLTFYRMRS